MIQRIQSVYLLLAGLINPAFLLTPLFDRAAEDPSRWVKSGILAGIVLTAIVSVLSIFFFKSRPSQMQWIKRAMMFQLLTMGAAAGIVVSLGGFGTFLLDELASFGVLVLGLLFQFLALRGVKSDEDLVRSVDRLR